MDIKGDTDKPKMVKQMKFEILSIAFYRGTILSKYALVFMLIAFYTYTMYKYAPAKPVIYILFLIFALPFFTQAFLSSFPIRVEKPYFPSIRKKYDYSIRNKQIQSSAILITYVTLIIWQKTYMPQYQVLKLYYYPTYMLAGCIALRIMLALFYYLYISRKLETGRLH